MSSTPSRASATSPAHQRTATTSSSSSSSLPPQTPSGASGPAAAISLDSLLLAHATDPDPKLAALEHAVSERNTLSSQNSQLWKLIEKQRSGYNQILKELERVRSERDGYKSKLGALVGASPRQRKDTLNGDKDSDADESRDLTTFQSNSTATPPRQKSSLTPLLVPPRAESLPLPASALGSATPENAPFSHAAKLANSTPSTAQSFGSNTPQHRQQSPLSSTPQTAVYTPTTAQSRSYIPNTSTVTITPPPIVTAPAESPVQTSPQQGPNMSRLAALNDSRTQPLSRESQISLPDEARHYIAAMGESPVPSPRVDAFAPRALPSAPVAPAVAVAPAAASKSEFLDLDDEAEDDDDEGRSDDDEADEADSTAFEIQPAVLPATQPLYAPRRPPPSDLTQSQPPQMSQPLEPDSVSSGYSGEPSQAQPLPSTIQQQIQQQRALAQQAQQQQQYGTQYQAAQYMSHQPPQPVYQQEPLATLQPLRPQVPSSVPASFRALPLLSSDLPSTTVTVSHSFVRPNDRGKEVLSFVVHVDPGNNNKEGWKVEKLYSDVIALDQRVRNSVGKTIGKKMVTLPEGKLWKDHAPAKVDQRKAILETYLQALVNLPVKNNDEVVAFLTSDIVRDYKQPVMQAGHKEGYLTKRGKNFGGWKTRFFVLQGPVLEYYDCRGGAHLGSITITGAQIGRQQRSDKPATDEEKEYRHAFLIVEAKKGPGGNHPRHVLCAESDFERDAWVEILVRYFSGAYSEEPVGYGQFSSPTNGYANGVAPQSRPSADTSYGRSASPARSSDSPVDRQGGAFNDSQAARRVLDQQPRQQPSSLPDSSPLSNAAASSSTPDVTFQRANSEQGYYPDMPNGTPRRRQHSPEQHRREGAPKGFQPTLDTVVSSPITPLPPQSDRPHSPDSKVKISGPINGAPIPAGYKFGGKDAAPAEPSTPASASDRREKVKSRSFWGFGRPGAGGEKAEKSSEKAPSVPVANFPHRAVFGVSLEESLDVAQIENLPAIVYRCIQYLQTKKADQEEGIYRLSGSSAVIKALKDRFNIEGDIDLVGSDEYWDPHAIAGLLKSFLRELPASILTHNLHMRFLSVVDYTDPQERIKELAQLIGALPFPNYSLLRALTAHLILIVQNATINKMTMRNVGIVFSPTLGIPAPLFNLMLSEFSRVFSKVDGDGAPYESSESPPAEAPAVAHEDVPSDDESTQYESGTETTEDNATAESSSSSPAPAESPSSGLKASKATSLATAKGLSVSLRGNRYSTMMGGGGIGLPASPRPPSSPRAAEA
uniref:RhoGAP-domain-containing protein n=1 Tax=Mycena chlorophos TaxID=658473 RepID=A0ABQ0LVJ2_MYCCL|nr:predicted protein [Mycena chlorophos]